VTAANNGFKRIKSVAATALVFDKSAAAMGAETGTGLTVQLFFGRVLKNETGTLIKRRSYTLERTMGVPNDSNPTEEQAEYLLGSIPNELTLNIAQATKITADLSFVAVDNTQIAAGSTLHSKQTSAVRPTLKDSDAFNTSSDFTRIKLYVYSGTSEAPAALFAYATELKLTINNNVSPNKAVGVLGAFDVSAGTFEVGGAITAYFAEVSAIAAVRNNSDVTLDMIMAKGNAGIAIDIPLLALGDARANIEQDAPITIPLNTAAATAAKIDTNLDHTLLMVFFDYLPTAAE
jgi:hypothetical protein